MDNKGNVLAALLASAGQEDNKCFNIHAPEGRLAWDGLKDGTYCREQPKIGRNEPCPCGSGKKYKKCHLGKERVL